MTWPNNGNNVSGARSAHSERDQNLARQLSAMSLNDKPGSSRSSKFKTKKGGMIKAVWQPSPLLRKDRHIMKCDGP
ncbi:hypothetical protein H5410_013916 [Solanum commersonii]|uniref:Uncharacterized protein n=1 Tax=Solanum commersonii TaxID=4109 RepID=A0A9J5ZPT1_SOLCO|nr:hypothetical protein H5410_013916 [Solanum commersonii]